MWPDYLRQREKKISDLKEVTGTSAARALVVCPHGSADYKTIGEAIRSAQPTTRILVRPGFYQESLVIDKHLEILGDGPVADITIESIDSACILMQTYYAVVRGFTLRQRSFSTREWPSAVDIPKGRLILENCDITYTGLACVYIHGGAADPYIRGCRIHDGAGIGVLVDEKSRGTIEECDFFANDYAGVEISHGGNPIIRRCQIHDGKRYGVCVSWDGQGTLEDCDIFANDYAGVNIEWGKLTIRRCQIHDGMSWGVYVNRNGQGTVEDCDIFGNAKAGVGLCDRSSATIRRCKINRNLRGVQVSCDGAGTFENCDLTGNALGAWYTIKHGSCVQGCGNKQ